MNAPNFLTTDTLLQQANLAYFEGNLGLSGYLVEKALHFRPLPVKAKGTPLNPPSVGKKTHK